jgi:PEP-CTERM motif
MNTPRLRKSLAALATLVALGMSPAAQAKAVDCDDMDGMLDACFSGLIMQPVRSPSFDDLSIGRFKLTELSDLTGYFSTIGLTFSEVSLWRHGSEVASDSNIADGISFADIGAGRYTVRVSGIVDGPQVGRKVLGAYAGGFAVTPSVPEPETYALLGAGLLAVFFMSRRRNGNA